MGPIWLLVGLIAGAAVGAWVMRRFERARVTATENAENVRLQTQLEAAQTVANAREDLVAVVKHGAGEELAQRGNEVVELVKAHLDTKLTESGADEQARRQAIEGVVAPVATTLKQLSDRLEQVDDSRQRTERELTAQLTGVANGQSEVVRSAASLERALRQPHVRGRWGELSLRRLAELTGMSEFADFEEQAHINDDGRVLRPDMLVRLPGDRLIVVDAKVPLSPFLDAMQATEEKQRVETLRLFARGMREHVRKLAAKEYQAQFQNTPDFVVMFVPGDHFLTGALEVDSELLEWAFGQRVHLATPATFMSLLRTVSYAFQQQRAAADAVEIARLGRELYDRVAKLLEHVDKVSRCVNSLVSAQDDVVGSLERRVLPTARKFGELDIAASNETLPAIRRPTATARRVLAAELSPSSDVHELRPPAEEAA